MELKIIKYILICIGILITSNLFMKGLRVWSWTKTQQTMFSKGEGTCEMFESNHNNYMWSIRCEE